MDHVEQSVAKFLENLAARTPTPGGGSASALGGAVGAALGSMAAAFTSGERFKAVESHVARISNELAALRQRFVELAQKDVDAYSRYTEARALPKNNTAEKQARRAAVEAAREAATAVPEQTVAAAMAGLGLIEELCAIANPRLASDVASAAYFLEAAARGAGIQVLANCPEDDTKETSVRRRAAVTEQIAACEAARERIHATVTKRLGEG